MTCPSTSGARPNGHSPCSLCHWRNVIRQELTTHPASLFILYFSSLLLRGLLFPLLFFFLSFPPIRVASLNTSPPLHTHTHTDNRHDPHQYSTGVCGVQSKLGGGGGEGGGGGGGGRGARTGSERWTAATPGPETPLCWRHRPLTRRKGFRWQRSVPSWLTPPPPVTRRPGWPSTLGSACAAVRASYFRTGRWGMRGGGEVYMPPTPTPPTPLHPCYVPSKRCYPPLYMLLDRHY